LEELYIDFIKPNSNISYKDHLINNAQPIAF